MKGEPSKEGNSSSLSNFKLKSKQSDDRSEGDTKRAIRNYKVMEDDKILEVTEKDIKRYKAEKEAYYQMYQIEKAKN